MSISTTIAPVASIVAQTQPMTHAKADSNASITSSLATSTAVGNAAVVTLTSSSKTRAASAGEARKVDASYDKEEIKKKEEEKKEGKADEAVEGSGKTVNVSA